MHVDEPKISAIDNDAGRHAHRKDPFVSMDEYGTLEGGGDDGTSKAASSTPAGTQSSSDGSSEDSSDDSSDGS